MDTPGRSNPSKATQSSFPVSGPTSHLKMTRPPGFFFFFSQSGQENGTFTIGKMHCGGDKTIYKNADNCVSKEPSLDGEATECRLCKHCGCMLNI